MEKIIAFSIVGFTLVTSKVVDLVKIVLSCIILTCIASYQDLLSFFSHIFHVIRFIFSLPRYLLFGDCNNNAGAGVGVDSDIEISSRLECDANENEKALLEEDHIEGLVGRFDERIGCLDEVLHLFDESEPIVEEIKETFDLFDENGDGYIAEQDLGKLFVKLGFLGFCQQDCTRMIQAFDDNNDGRIDFGEFLKLMEESFNL